VNKKVDTTKFDDGEEYIIFFITSDKQIMFLAYSADMNAICCNSNLILPVTLDYQLAKRYKTLEEGKDDVYKLRYYRREFLKVAVGIKSIFKDGLMNTNDLLVLPDKKGI